MLSAETSLRVTGVLSIANWNLPQTREVLAPWPVRALTSYPQVLASAQEAGMLNPVGVSRADPARPTRSTTPGACAPRPPAAPYPPAPGSLMVTAEGAGEGMTL
jgi:hypothetical protein